MVYYFSHHILILIKLFAFIKNVFVIAITRRNDTCSILTSAKLKEGYLVVGITRELDKKPLLYCYPIYISYRWSMLQQYVYLMSTPQWLCKTVHHALTSICPICGSNVVYMLPNINLSPENIKERRCNTL